MYFLIKPWNAAFVILALGIIFIAFRLGSIETARVRLVGEYNQGEFSFRIKWPTDAGAIVEIGQAGELSGNITFEIFKDDNALLAIEYKISKQDEDGMLTGKGLQGCPIAFVHAGILKKGETYRVRGTFTGEVKGTFSIWLGYVAPWMFGLNEASSALGTK